MPKQPKKDHEFAQRGRAVRDARIAYGIRTGSKLSQEGLVDLMRTVGGEGAPGLVERGMIGKIETGYHEAQEQTIKLIEKALRISDNSLSNVYYNGIPIKGAASRETPDRKLDAFDREPVPVDAAIVAQDSTWLTGGEKLQVKVNAVLLGVTSLIYARIETAFGSAKRGNVLVFKPDESDRSDIFLLFRNKKQPDKRLIGVYRRGAPGRIFTGNTTNIPDTDWESIAFCRAICWGPVDRMSDHYFKEGGIGPDARLDN